MSLPYVESARRSILKVQIHLLIEYYILILFVPAAGTSGPELLFQVCRPHDTMMSYIKFSLDAGYLGGNDSSIRSRPKTLWDNRRQRNFWFWYHDV